MKSVHLPRNFVILFLILLAAAFLAGNVLVFSSVHAATPPAPAPTVTGTPQVFPTPTATLPPAPPSADTTGILILGILVVVIILVGLVWGSRIRRK